MCERCKKLEEGLEKISRLNTAQADLVDARIKSGYTPPEMGVPVMRSFKRTAKWADDALAE